MIQTYNWLTVEMNTQTAKQCSHQGDCDADVAANLRDGWINFRPLSATCPLADALFNELKDYGAWSDSELADTEQNKARMAWIAAGDIVDSIR